MEVDLDEEEEKSCVMDVFILVAQLLQV